MPSTDILPLSRITTRYSETEDRVLVAGSTAEDKVFNAWITQRLMNRLVSKLCQLLSPSEMDGLSAVLNDFAQVSAEAAIVPTPPVPLNGDGVDVLVTSIDLQNHSDFVQIVLRAENSVCGLLRLTRRELRQWLSFVRRAYREADWPIQVWPDWLLEPKR